MKTTTIALLMAISFNSFGGILENRRTGETIELILDRRTQTVEVLSTAGGVPNTTLSIHKVQATKTKRATQYALSEAVFHEPVISTTGTVAGLLVFGGYLTIWAGALTGGLIVIGGAAAVAGGGAAILDTILLPIKAIKTASFKKDKKFLVEAINSIETVSVNGKRFDRIRNMLADATAAQ